MSKKLIVLGEISLIKLSWGSYQVPEEHLGGVARHVAMLVLLLPLSLGF